MKEKINKWLDTPITWRASCKASIYVLAGELICFGAYYAYITYKDRKYWKEIAKKKEETLNDWTTTEETEA